MNIRNLKWCLNKLEHPSAAKPNMFFFSSFWGLKPSSNDSFWCVDMAIWRDFTVGVQKRRFMVQSLWHHNLSLVLIFVMVHGKEIQGISDTVPIRLRKQAGLYWALSGLHKHRTNLQAAVLHRMGIFRTSACARLRSSERQSRQNIFSLCNSIYIQLSTTPAAIRRWLMRRDDQIKNHFRTRKITLATQELLQGATLESNGSPRNAVQNARVCRWSIVYCQEEEVAGWR